MVVEPALHLKQWPLRHECATLVLAYLLLCEIEVSALTPAPTCERPPRAARGRAALGPGSGNDPGQLRLRAIRRAEPDVSKLVEWVLNITQARWDAYRAGEPDPYDLPAPANLSRLSDARDRVEEHEEPELLHRRRRTA